MASLLRGGIPQPRRELGLNICSAELAASWRGEFETAWAVSSLYDGVNNEGTGSTFFTELFWEGYGTQWPSLLLGLTGRFNLISLHIVW